MAMLQFNVVIAARPGNVKPGPEVALRGRSLPTLDIDPADSALGFPRSFEEVADAFITLERMFFEPDGSFVWVSSGDDESWQLDGMVYDRAGRVVSLELKGTCHAEALDRLIAALGSSPHQVVYQLTHEGVVLDDEAFRRYAER